MIEGYVIVDNTGQALWDEVADTREHAIRRFCAPGEWYLYEKSGWRVVKVREVFGNECLGCKGTGVQRHRILNGPDEGQEFDATCSECDGTGRAP